MRFLSGERIDVIRKRKELVNVAPLGAEKVKRRDQIRKRDLTDGGGLELWDETIPCDYYCCCQKSRKQMWECGEPCYG